MAVQAQSSSNILLLNRTLQEGKPLIGNNYSLPPQSASLLNDFPVGDWNTNQRKRRREDNMNRFIPNNVHKIQSHSDQFMDVFRIESGNVDVSTGLRLAFNDHHHHQQQQHSFNHQAYGAVSLLTEDLSNLINQQGDEIERYLQAQAEEVRRTLVDKRQRHYSTLIGAANKSALMMIKEKEAVAERAIRRNVELEARASQLKTEAQVWQAKAEAQEAVAVALQAQLQQTVVAGVGRCVSQVAGGDVEDAESSYVDPERVVVGRGPGCKACGKRVASVVLLPCRHLCVCSECDDVVQSCPLCLSFRSSSVEVYVS